VTEDACCGFDWFRSDLERLWFVVTAARSKKSTQWNQMLLPAEDELSKLTYSLSLAVNEVSTYSFQNAFSYALGEIIS